ncbi:unnamed protein product, partial [Mesorhabditis belari]|uniref:RRM domain-containing protein n=1 Tax=Mesorhabditis belari TaxID=2138241 RepID=A0AAF3J3C0_9BILA
MDMVQFRLCVTPAKSPPEHNFIACPMMYGGSGPLDGMSGYMAPLLTEIPRHEIMPNRVFVSGFGLETTESELRQLFECAGKVKEAKIIKSLDGLSKGYAFVTYETEADAENGRRIPTQDLELNGRFLKVAPAYRKINTPRIEDYAIATPNGIISPTQGYGYAFPQPVPFYLIGVPQPPPFAYVMERQRTQSARQPGKDTWSTDQASPMSTPANSPCSPNNVLAPPSTPLSPPMYNGGSYYLGMPGTPMSVSPNQASYGHFSLPSSIFPSSLMSPASIDATKQGQQTHENNNHNYNRGSHFFYKGNTPVSKRQPIQTLLNMNLQSTHPLQEVTNDSDYAQRQGVQHQSFMRNMKLRRHNIVGKLDNKSMTPPATPKRERE